MNNIPKHFHYVWFSNNPKELTYLQFFSIISTHHFHPDYKINLFTDNGFYGELWDKVSNFVNVYNIERPKIDALGVDYSKFIVYSDVSRHLIIKEYGGIYCDLDIVWKKSITPLIESLVSNPKNKIYALGAQGKNACEGINIGVLIAEKDNNFVDAYLDTYKDYSKYVKTSSDHITYYSNHIIYNLIKQNPDLGTILDYNLFHWPLYHVTKNWFLMGDKHPELIDGPKFNKYGGGYWSNENLDEGFAHHCFFINDRLKDNAISINAFSEDKYQKDIKIDPSNIRAGQYNYDVKMTVREFIQNIDSPFTQLCKPLLKYL